MRLDDVVAGRIYIDVNVFYMYLRSDTEHLACLRSFLARVVRGHIEAFTAVLTMDELFYRLLLGRVRDVEGCNPLNLLRQKGEEVVKSYSPEIRVAIRKLIQLPHLHLEPVIMSDIVRMLDNIHAFGLLPRDALHVAVMQRLDIGEVASDDLDFDRVLGVQRHWLFNRPVSPVTDLEAG